MSSKLCLDRELSQYLRITNRLKTVGQIFVIASVSVLRVSVLRVSVLRVSVLRVSVLRVSVDWRWWSCQSGVQSRLVTSKEEAGGLYWVEEVTNLPLLWGSHDLALTISPPSPWTKCYNLTWKLFSIYDICVYSYKVQFVQTKSQILFTNHNIKNFV